MGAGIRISARETAYSARYDLAAAEDTAIFPYRADNEHKKAVHEVFSFMRQLFLRIWKKRPIFSYHAGAAPANTEPSSVMTRLRPPCFAA